MAASHCRERSGDCLLRLGLQASLVFVVPAVFHDLFSAERVFDNGDDQVNYLDNPLLRPVAPGGWCERLWQILTSRGSIGVWEPTSLLAKLLLARCFGLAARTFTGAAAALHAVTCALALQLCLAAERLLQREQGEGEVLHAWAAALIVGLHPLRVEPLAWASGLPYEVSTVLALLAALCHLRHQEQLRETAASARPLGPWRLASALLLLLAGNAKAAALGLGPVLVLWDALLAWEARRDRAGAAGGVIAILADNLATFIASIAAAVPAFAATTGGDRDCKFQFLWWQRWLRASHMMVLYLLQQLWPKDLCVLHAVPAEEITPLNWHFGGALLAAIICVCLTICTGVRAMFVVAAYVTLLSPTLGIVSDHITETAADRYCHICCMTLGVPVLAAVLKRLRPKSALATLSIVLGVVSCESVITRNYVQLWRRPEITIQHAVSVSPRFYRTRYIYGMQLLHEGKAGPAENELRASLALCPRFENTHYALTQTLASLGRLPEAADAMRAGVAYNPSNHLGHVNLGMLLQQAHRHKEAAESLSRALRLEPSDGDAHRMLQNSRAALRQEAASQQHRQTSTRQPSETTVTSTRQPAMADESPRPAPSTQPKSSTEAAAPSRPAGAACSGEAACSASGGPARAGSTYLSIVVASRNDDYAGRMEERFVTHVALLVFQLKRACFRDAELLLVEWNPPKDRPGLAGLVKDALALGNVSGGRGSRACDGDGSPAVRQVTARPSLHKSLQREGLLGPAPMAEYFAKNLGIRHALGEFVLVTNPDIVFSPQLVAFLATRTLRQDTFYTAGLRFDTQWPERPTEPGAYLRALMRRARDDTRLEGTDYAASVQQRPEGHQPAEAAFRRLCSKGDDGSGKIGGYFDFHAGDFVLAARSRWHEVAAYPELNWTFGVDSAALCKFFGRGLRNAALLPPCLVVHQHHRIRENPNARRVMHEGQLCELCKRQPLGRFDPRQRDPQLWGMHSLKFIKIVELAPAGLLTEG